MTAKNSRNYNIYKAGGSKLGTVYTTCITEACKNLVATLECCVGGTWKYKLDNRECATVRNSKNYNVMGDFVITTA